MSVRLGASEPAEIPALKALWKQAFGDEDCWIDLFFTQAYAPAGLFVLREDDAVAAMAAWFPGTLCHGKSGWPTAYLYAVATDAAYQKRGYCRRLLDFMAGALAGAGIECLCLRPGAPTLFDFYEKLGFSTFFTCETQKLGALANAFGTVTAAEPPAYLMEREAFLQGNTYLSTPTAVLAYQKKAAQLGGGDLYLLQDGALTGCALAVRTEAGAEIQELLWPGDPAQAAALICKHLGVSRATVRTPGPAAPFGMLKWLRTPPPLAGGYLGIALE